MTSSSQEDRKRIQVLKVEEGCSLIECLPAEILLYIVGYLEFPDVLRFRVVCKQFSTASIGRAFQSLQIFLSAYILDNSPQPFLNTAVFCSLATSITIIVGKPLKPNSKAVDSRETGLLLKTTSVLSNLCKITLDLTKLGKTSPSYGSFFVKFFEALHSDPQKARIKTLAIKNLPPWVLQMLREENPEALRGALRHVKELSLTFTSELSGSVKDSSNIYRCEYPDSEKAQLESAHDSVRALLTGAKVLYELDFKWFSKTTDVATWKAISPIGDLTSLCRPAAGADAARFLLIGRPYRSTSWVDADGVWKVLKCLKLANLIMCSKQLLNAILGAKDTLRKLELSDILLNISCGGTSWTTGVLDKLYRTKVSRLGQEQYFRMDECILSGLGYTSVIPNLTNKEIIAWQNALTIALT